MIPTYDRPLAMSTTQKLQQALDKRIEADIFRQLRTDVAPIDFCSNDYLSFARSEIIMHRAQEQITKLRVRNGSTGSRSISGNTEYAESLENFLAGFHRTESALLFNSGYDANLGLFSSIAKREDFLITDELVHASIIDGCRLSYATRLRFAHNDIADLESKLRRARETQTTPDAAIYVAVESVYSMDGDIAPLAGIVDLCKKYDAALVVDEAHATGVFGNQGRGLVNEFGLENEIFARVHTFGKAIGTHGAIVAGPLVLRNYLVNFARSFIFTTALPLHSLVTIRCAYEQLQGDDFDAGYLHELISLFKKDFNTPGGVYLIESPSPVQSLVIPGATHAKSVAAKLQAMGFDICAIVSPSVPVGKERLRISLHMHNTKDEIMALKNAIQQILFA